MGLHFINPNWHVTMIHLPLGLLTAGVILELICILYRKDWLQNAGRLMILIGMIGSVVAAAAGIYAFRHVVAIDMPTLPETQWVSLVEKSNWSPAQWHLISNHLIFNLAAVACFSFTVVVWLAGTQNLCKRLYWPVLLILLLGTVLMIGGARYGGDAVYLHGIAINPAVLHQHNNTVQHDSIEPEKGVEYIIEPLQLHVIMAGTVAALLLVTIAISINYIAAHKQRPVSANILSQRFVLSMWLFVLMLSLVTAFAGLWSAMGRISIENLKLNFQMLGEPDHKRLLVHFIAAVTLAFFIFITGAAMQYSKKKLLSVILIAANVLLACVVIWVGTLMLFDSHEGPLLRFASANDEYGQTHHQHTSDANVPSHHH